MKPVVAVFAILFVSFAAGCVTPGGGQNQNENANTNGAPPGGGEPNDNSGDGAGSNDNAANDNAANDNAANDNATNGDDANDNVPDDSGDLPIAFRLDGAWDDNGRHIFIEQNGTMVEANYFTERYCDPEIGPVDEPSPGADSTTFDFQGTLNNGEDVLPGDMITGEVITCWYGFDSGGNGFVLAPMTLLVVDENNMSGEYEYDGDGDGELDSIGTFTVTRQQ